MINVSFEGEVAIGFPLPSVAPPSVIVTVPSPV